MRAAFDGECDGGEVVEGGGRWWKVVEGEVARKAPIFTR